MRNKEYDHEQREKGNRLHQRMLDGDVTAFGEIAEWVLPIITHRLSMKFPNLYDPDLIDTAIVDALINYQNKPTQYDMERKRLDNYIYMSAWGDLVNMLERDKKDDVLVALPDIVELDEQDSELILGRPEVASKEVVETDVLNKLSPTWKNLRKLFPDALDQALLMLILDNIRETNYYADVLGITNYPIDEQRRIVKKHKDRIKVKLRRNIDISDL